MKHRSTTALLSFLFCMGNVALAANPFFTDGDLVLFFQKPGSANTIYVSLGSAANQFRGSAAGPTADRQALDIINIDAELDAAFGNGWPTDPEIFAGLAAVRSTSPSTTLVIDSDPARTLYASQSRLSVGTLGAAGSEPWDFSQSGFSGPATNIFGMNSVLGSLYTTKAAVSPVADSFIDNQNPILVAPGGGYLQQSAFNAFPGGVQQQGGALAFGTFGPAGQVEFALDLFRILPRITAAGQITGPDKVGSYEGTVTVSTTGSVSFITQGTASPYDTWIGTFNPPLTNANDRLPIADPDNDGLNNLMEFVLNGNPGVSDPAIAPDLDATGSNFVFTFNRRDDSEPGATLRFQYGTDLIGWTDATIGAGNSVVGNATIVVTENAANADAISVTVPKSVAPGGKLFGRLRYTQP